MTSILTRSSARLGLAVLTTAGAVLTAAAGSPGGAQEAEPVTVELTCTGAPETFTVPDGVTELAIEAFGAAGGGGWNESLNGEDPSYTPVGLGGSATGTLAVAPGQELVVTVGCAGFTVPDDDTGSSPGGFGGSPGGSGGPGGDRGTGGSGGGSSDVRVGGAGLSDRVLVAGGGGGSGGVGESGPGGDGGGASGADGGDEMGADGGGGGTPAAGGGGGAPSPGQCDEGEGAGFAGTDAAGGDGNGCAYGSGGGGGGGWFGGGGGAGATAGGGGGGGSSYVALSLTAPGTSAGVRSGHGLVRITYVPPATPATPTPAAEPAVVEPQFTG